MTTIDGFDFFPLTFDERGGLVSRAEFDAFTKRAGNATDAVFLAHGFRNDVNDATKLYTTFLTTLRANVVRPEFHDIADRDIVVAGIFWPSKPFREMFDEASLGGTRGLFDEAAMMTEVRARLEKLKKEDATPPQRAKLDTAIELLPALEANPKAQDEFVALVLSLLDHSTLDRTEGLPQIRRRKGSDTLARLSAAPAGTRGVGNVFGGVAGAVGQFLNLTTWYVMKDRSGTVGATGVADAVRALHASHPRVRIHLVGHSLGGRLIAGCAKALCASPRLQPDSLLLLEAAFSHFGFSPDNGHGTPGFFRDVVGHRLVKGPFLSTFSAEDTVVGKAYSIMSRLAHDSTRDIGDASDEFGGIGRNGALKTPETATQRLHAAGRPYEFAPDVINNLDGSGGFIKDHSDVTNAAITYAFASAIART
jgi:hypothetical protein